MLAGRMSRGTSVRSQFLLRDRIMCAYHRQSRILCRYPLAALAATITAVNNHGRFVFHRSRGKPMTAKTNVEITTTTAITMSTVMASA